MARSTLRHRATGSPSREPIMRLHSAFLILTLVGLTAGCVLGPGTVIRDRFDYSAAVADSWKSQMLLNLVRFRYGDTGVFLEVGQIVAGYTVESTVSASAAWNLFGFSIPHPSVPNNSISAGVAGRFTDRPTVTYNPLVGERFSRSMLTPVPPAAMVSVVNGIDNRFGGDLRAHPADPEFYALLERMRRIQLSGGIGMRVRRLEGDE